MSNDINPNRAAVLAAQAANNFREVVLANVSEDSSTKARSIRAGLVNAAWSKYHDAVVTMANSIGITDEDAIAVIMTAITAATTTPAVVKI